MKEMACSSRVTVEHLMKGPFTKMLERFQKTNWGQCSLWGQVAAGTPDSRERVKKQLLEVGESCVQKAA